MLNQLKRKDGSHRARKRVGRGVGGGWAKTSGRGQKGAGARAGFKSRAWVEGGQMPLVRRLPKRGFRNLFAVEHQVVNVGGLGGFAAGSEVDVAALVAAGLVHSVRHTVKLLGEGELGVRLRLRVQAASEQARRKVEAAGGSVELVPAPARRAAGASAQE
jgi:large subunit ribosomal protein L15